MSLLDRLGNTLWRRTANHDLIAEELEFHVELLTRENIAAGMSAAAARAAALRRFGNPLLLRERTMAADRLAWLDALSRDLRLAVRSLVLRRGHRGLALTAVCSLALGIGANSALFSVVDAVLLRPLPLPHPERLIVIEESKNGKASGSNPARLADWGSQVTGIAAAAGFYGEGLVLTGQGDPARLSAMRTLGRPFEVLGVRPLLGRRFTAAEEAGQGDRVVLLGESFWRRRFGADRGVLGKSLSLSGEPFAVIGVVPDRLGYPEDWDVLAPAPAGVQQASRKAGFLKVIARLRPGISPAGVQAELATVAGRLAKQYPDSDAGRRARAVPLQEDQTRGARLPLLVLLGTVALVLLLLARAAERRREAAIRVALGAGRGGLTRLYLAESLVLALTGDTYWPLVRFAVRAQGDPRALTAAVRATVHRIAPDQVIDGIATMEEQVGRAAAEPRARVLLLGAFAILALWLAALGLYGVLSSDVAQRSHEIGVRLALGADRHQVLAAILWKGTSVALCGLLLGLAGAVLLGRGLGALLFGVTPLDPPVLLGVSLVILAVAATASYLPARRAAAVDPGAILRHE